MESVALYIRVSTIDQLEFSPDAQKKALMVYAKTNNMFVEPDNIFVDEGISGRKAEKRPAFMSMIGKAKNKPKPFDFILVHKFDRFARSREDSIVYKSMLLKECGIKVISITESIEDDKFSIILESMLEAMAEYYSINLSEEVKKGMTEKATRGEIQSRPAFGYKVENNKFIIISEEAEIIKYIFDQYLNHNLSLFVLARKLNDLGFRTKANKAFDTLSIRYILNNPVYCGYLRWTPTGKTPNNFDNPNTMIVKSTHEPIISKEIFDKVQNKYKNHIKNTKYHARPETEQRHWLSGLVYCSVCSGVLSFHTSKYPSFRCMNYCKGKCKASSSISVIKLEKSVIDDIKNTIDDIKNTIDMFSNDNYNINIELEKPDKTEIELLEKQLKRIKDSQKRIKEAFVAGIDTLEEYGQNKQMLKIKEDELNYKINKVNLNETKEISHLLNKDMLRVYDIILDNDIDMNLKRSMIRSIIKKIIYTKKTESIQVNYYS